MYDPCCCSTTSERMSVSTRQPPGATRLRHLTLIDSPRAAKKPTRGGGEPMTIAPLPDHPLTLDEWDALPAEPSYRYELVKGDVLVVPRPVLLHQRAMSRLGAELDWQLPPELGAFPDSEVVVDATFPPTV